MASLYKRGDTFWVKYYRPGQRKPIRASLDTSDETKALSKLKKLEVDLAAGRYQDVRIEKIRFGQLLDLVLTEYRNLDRKSYRQAKSRIEGTKGKTGHIRPYFGDRRALTITPADASRYIEKRRAAQATNGTINRELDLINKAFRLGKESYDLPGVAFKKLRESNARTGFLDRLQVASICRRLPKWCANVVWFGFWTGWRISEIRSLEWYNVDLDAGEIRLSTSKNEDGRVIKTTAELRTLLESITPTLTPVLATPAPAGKDGVPPSRMPAAAHLVFVRLVKSRNALVPVGDFGKLWDKACADAGLPGRIFHDLRRSAVRNFVRAGIPERVAMQMTGHKTRDVFERYNIVSSGDLEAAAKRLDEIAGTSTGTNGCK